MDQTQTKQGWSTSINLPFTVKDPQDNATKDYWSVEWDATNNVVVAK